MADGFLIEVCVDSVESAVNAERGGLYGEHWGASTHGDGSQHSQKQTINNVKVAHLQAFYF